MVPMGFLKILQKLFQKNYFEYIFIIFILDISWIINLQIYEEFLRLWQKNGHQLNINYQKTIREQSFSHYHDS
jgi:hypothetical protein